MKDSQRKAMFAKKKSNIVSGKNKTVWTGKEWVTVTKKNPTVEMAKIAKNQNGRLRQYGINGKIVFFNDPSHGYYKVPKKALEDLGILGDITEYSKRGKSVVYLEEDQDMTTFTNALKTHGVHLTEKDFTDKYYDNPAKNPARKFY